MDDSGFHREYGGFISSFHNQSCGNYLPSAAYLMGTETFYRGRNYNGHEANLFGAYCTVQKIEGSHKCCLQFHAVAKVRLLIRRTIEIENILKNYSFWVFIFVIF